MTDRADRIRAMRCEAKNILREAAFWRRRAALLRREANRLERAEKRALERSLLRQQ